MKICIVGPSGAGKSTISKKLAKIFEIEQYQFDEIYWDLSGDEFVKNSEDLIAKAIEDILKKEDWIVEGAYDKRMSPFFVDCSLILKMEVPFGLRSIRLIRRLLLSKVKRKKPKETLSNTIELIRFSYIFDKKLNLFLEQNMFSKKVVKFRDLSSSLDVIKNRQ
ncbi:AAA family ATPase [Acinetobacter sp. ME22]|uniref:AAA family ATPase n=1 Tax=Acinetobacter sp. ME22 TaxID=2904802 RepID=UPI001EDAEB95|nr:AAA family ATPase [Acinetobacter sp. ME22]MCG2575291.1 AAA family ATPase [Acinetobacter sp. ME22]